MIYLISYRTYPFCPVGDYQTTSQSYYSTTANYSTTNTPPSHASGLPYLVPGEENLLLNTSSQSRESPPSLSVRTSSILFYYDFVASLQNILPLSLHYRKCLTCRKHKHQLLQLHQLLFPQGREVVVALAVGLLVGTMEV